MKGIYLAGTAFIFIAVSFLGGFGVGFARDRILKERTAGDARERPLSPAFSIEDALERANTAIDQNKLHYGSFPSDKTFFEDAYRRASPAPDMHGEDIRGALVNHHLLASHLIARIFSAFATNEPRVVVLVSPDHFMRGKGTVTLSAEDWQTPYGILKADGKLISRLADAGVGVIDEHPFESAPGRVEGEHGIANIVAFIKRSIPNARFIPIIIKDTLSQEDSAILATSETRTG